MERDWLGQFQECLFGHRRRTGCEQTRLHVLNFPATSYRSSRQDYCKESNAGLAGLPWGRKNANASPGGKAFVNTPPVMAGHTGLRAICTS